ncbi:hypothetical protein [Lactobacillus iners]|uniref:hypothetical protein n=1 Tax=Lactobacillus iners TaxID=147802 RepID=UPI0001FD7E8D|nr:hypothetical protein [Lactobacillus iners]EGC80224.1 conserved domain protein [Lactobacillus iners UPII 60-B]
MAKNFIVRCNANDALNALKVKVNGFGERQVNAKFASSQKDVEKYPHYVDVIIINDPNGWNTEANLRIKAGDISNLQVGQEFTLGKDVELIDGIVIPWHTNNYKYENVSIKCSRFQRKDN